AKKSRAANTFFMAAPMGAQSTGPYEARPRVTKYDVRYHLLRPQLLSSALARHEQCPLPRTCKHLRPSCPTGRNIAVRVEISPPACAEVSCLCAVAPAKHRLKCLNSRRASR